MLWPKHANVSYIYIKKGQWVTHLSAAAVEVKVSSPKNRGERISFLGFITLCRYCIVFHILCMIVYTEDVMNWLPHTSKLLLLSAFYFFLPLLFFVTWGRLWQYGENGERNRNKMDIKIIKSKKEDMIID